MIGKIARVLCEEPTFREILMQAAIVAFVEATAKQAGEKVVERIAASITRVAERATEEPSPPPKKRRGRRV